MNATLPNKILALILCLCLVGTAIPSLAFADENTSTNIASAETATAAQSNTDESPSAIDNTDGTSGEYNTSDDTDSSALHSDSNASTDLNKSTQNTTSNSADFAGANTPFSEGESLISSNSTQEPRTFQADNFIQNFSFTLKSDGKTKSYDLTNGQTIDIASDFPNGISRETQYSGNLMVDVKQLAESADAYPLVPGDTITCNFPTILKENYSFSGHLHDIDANWDTTHDGVGEYKIENGTLTFTYDDGYIQEKNGKVLTSSVKFSGGFDTSNITSDETDLSLTFGSITINTSFSKAEVFRYVTVDTRFDRTQFSRIAVNDGYLSFVVKVKALDSNTDALTNVVVSNFFDEKTQAKIIPSTLELSEAHIDDEDIL